MGVKQCFGYAAYNKSGHLKPYVFTRRATRPEDVCFKIKFCGICHTDLHQIRDEWKELPATYPMVPGHEIVGVVCEVGSEVRNFKVGDRVGVGCIVNSCGFCDKCYRHLEQHCERKFIWTYNDRDIYLDGGITYGGYSTMMVIPERYCLKIPESLPLDAAAPLLCAGITVYSPMKHYEMEKGGKNFGVIGLGGLGYMAAKFAKAFGMRVTVISTSPEKEDEARNTLRADNFVVSKCEKSMGAARGLETPRRPVKYRLFVKFVVSLAVQPIGLLLCTPNTPMHTEHSSVFVKVEQQAAQKTLDFIIDTVSGEHSMDHYLPLLRTNGKIVLVGIPSKPLQVSAFNLHAERRCMGGSLIGGIRETQEMLDFCGKHHIFCKIEKIPFDYLNEAMRRLTRSDVQYRFVIDVANSTPSEYRPCSGAF